MNKFLPSEEFHGNGDEETAKKSSMTHIFENALKTQWYLYTIV